MNRDDTIRNLGRELDELEESATPRQIQAIRNLAGSRSLEWSDTTTLSEAEAYGIIRDGRGNGGLEDLTKKEASEVIGWLAKDVLGLDQ